jgi:tRNA threonylcarbamoyl adenosine modification protein YeaZ
MPQYDLLIDTSIFGAAVGLRHASQGLVYCQVASDVQNSARQLPLMVEEAVQGANTSLTGIRRVVVSQGPGSFTGIRVGIAYAYGFFKGLVEKVGAEAAIAGVSSLELVALNVSKKASRDIALFLPSTKTTGFFAMVKQGVSSLHPIDLSKDLGDTLKSLDWKVLGQWDALGEKANSLHANSIELLDLRESARLALLAIDDRLSTDTTLNWSVDMPSAIYLRQSTVEEKARK